MALKDRLEALATRSATEDKSIRTLLNGNLATLAALTTTVKTNIVAALNEIHALISGKQDALGFTPLNAATLGQPNGVASLDAGGLVPSSQLPSFVDDVLEFANVAAFPATGMSGKLYVAADTSRSYRWTGTVYTEIIASPGTTDAVTEGATNLYFTNARAISALAPSLGDTDADLVAVFEAGLL